MIGAGRGAAAITPVDRRDEVRGRGRGIGIVERGDILRERDVLDSGNGQRLEILDIVEVKREQRAILQNLDAWPRTMQRNPGATGKVSAQIDAPEPEICLQREAIHW